MDRYGVCEALLRAGVSSDAFAVEGVHDVSIPMDFWFLRRSPKGRWEVGAYERGVYDVRYVYDSESEAAARLYTSLTIAPPPD